MRPPKGQWLFQILELCEAPKKDAGELLRGQVPRPTRTPPGTLTQRGGKVPFLKGENHFFFLMREREDRSRSQILVLVLVSHTSITENIQNDHSTNPDIPKKAGECCKDQAWSFRQTLVSQYHTHPLYIHNTHIQYSWLCTHMYSTITVPIYTHKYHTQTHIAYSLYTSIQTPNPLFMYLMNTNTQHMFDNGHFPGFLDIQENKDLKKRYGKDSFGYNSQQLCKILHIQTISSG